MRRSLLLIIVHHEPLFWQATDQRQFSSNILFFILAQCCNSDLSYRSLLPHRVYSGDYAFALRREHEHGGRMKVRKVKESQSVLENNPGNH